jgi:hypothetical protein
MKLQSTKLNVLYSYAYLRSNKALETELLLLSEKGLINLLIDSGAFTAHNSGNPIDLPAYIEACKRYDGRCWQYVALDVIEDKEQTQENLNLMAKANLKPMPVLTTDEDVSMAMDMVAFNPHIGVPGGTRTKGDWMKQRFQQVDKVTDGYAKIHGLGYVTFPEMYQLPLKTVDSSTWTMGRRFGTVKWFDKKNGLECIQAAEMRKPNHKDIPAKLKELWTDMGLNPKDRFKDEYYSGRDTFNNYAITEAYLDMFRYSRRQGLEFFFVCGDLIDIATIGAIDKCRHEKGRVVYSRVKELIAKAKETKSIKGLLI